MDEGTVQQPQPSNSGPPNGGDGLGGSDIGSEWQTLGNHDAINPTTATPGEPAAPRRRGRKPGSKNRTSQKTSADLGLIAGSVVFIHSVIAGALAVPELELSDDEAQKLTKASLDVAAHYNAVPDEKTMAWLSLGAAVGAIYGTRYMAWRVRMQNEAEAKKQPPQAAASNVVQMGMMFNNGQANTPI